MKPCRRCKEEFEPTASQIKKSDFLCRSCWSTYTSARWARLKAAGVKRKLTPRDHERARKWREANGNRPEVRERRLAWKRAYRKSPEVRKKDNARTRVAYEIRMGRMVRGPCERCGASPSTTEAHHTDYDQPLLVTWLCKDCHEAAHHKETAA